MYVYLKCRTCPIDLKEAIASVIFASMRCSDVTELGDVRKNFTSKYGKEFATSALEVRPDSGVNRLVYFFFFIGFKSV
jgi:vacuolar protein sorting-associated protein IST1